MFRSRTERRKNKLKKGKIRKAQDLSGSQISIAFRRFRKNRSGLIGLILTVSIFAIGIYADILAPYDPLEPQALYYDYQPWYQPPGIVEAADFSTTVNQLATDPDDVMTDQGAFEPDEDNWNYGTLTNGSGWEKINLMTEGYYDPAQVYITIFNSAICDVDDVALSYNVNEMPGYKDNLFYTDIIFFAKVLTGGTAEIEVSYIFADGTKESVIFEVSEREFTRQRERVNVKDPISVEFVKLSGPTILIDEVELQAGDYVANTHVLGTNRNSQDLYSKILHGTRITLIVVLGAILISLIIGLPLGLVSGYFRGRIDSIIMRFTDIFLTLPFYFVMILIITVIGQTQWLDNLIIELGLSAEVIILSVTIGLGIFGWMGITRLVRATILQIREMDYVEAAKALGASDRRIMIVHVLPNILAPLIVSVTYNLAVNIVAEAGLAFLGFTDESLSSWGRELFDGFGIVTEAPWTVLFPAILIILAVMAFNLLGDGLRDAFDPRIR